MYNDKPPQQHFPCAPPPDVAAYYHQTIAELGLSPTEARRYGLSPAPNGDLLLTAYHYTGYPVQYVPEDRKRAYRNLQRRKSTGEVHERAYLRTYQRRRLHPDRVRLNGAKYIAPKGQGVPAFPMPAAREAYQRGVTGGVVVFVEGEKKAVALDRAGIEAVGFTGLSLYRLDAATEDYLASRRPDLILVLYDGDYLEARTDKTTGQVTSRRPENFYQSAQRFAGQLFDHLADTNHEAKVAWCAVHPDHPEKGADDLLASTDNPLAAARELATLTASTNWTFAELDADTYEDTLASVLHLDTPAAFLDAHGAQIGQQPFTFWGLDYQQREGCLVMLSDPYAVDVRTDRVEITSWLSEAAQQIEDLLASNGGRLAIQSDTGTGKTTWAINRAKASGRRLVLVVPTRSLCRQLATQHDVYPVFGRADGEREADAAAALVVVATYDTVHHLPDLDRRTVVVDEAHDLVNHYTFRRRALNRLQQVTTEAAEVIYLSGTMPCGLLKSYDVPLVDVRRTNSPTVQLRYQIAENSGKRALTESLAANLVTDLQQQPDSLHVVLFNNTERLDAVRDLFLVAGHLRPDEVQVCSRSHSDRGETDGFDDLERTEYIRPGVRLVLTTSILAEGVNVRNVNVGKVYSVGVMCPDTVRQFAARFRAVREVDLVLILKPDRGAGRHFARSAEAELAELTERAELAARHTNDLLKIAEKYDSAPPQRSELLPHIMPSVTGEGFEVDQLAILSNIRQRMLRTAPPSYLIGRLLSYDGFTLATEDEAEAVLVTDEMVGTLKAITAARKAIEDETLAHLRVELDERPEVALASLYRHYQQSRDYGAAKSLRALAEADLATVPDLDAIEWTTKHAAALQLKAGRELIRRAGQLIFAGVVDRGHWLDLSPSAWRREWKRTTTAAGLRVITDPKQARALPAGLRLDLRVKAIVVRLIEDHLASDGPTITDGDLADLVRKTLTVADGRAHLHRAPCLATITKGRARQLVDELYQTETTRHGTRMLVTIGARFGQLGTDPDFVASCIELNADPLKIKDLTP